MIDEGKHIFDGNVENQETIEGSKMYKKKWLLLHLCTGRRCEAGLADSTAQQEYMGNL